MNNDDPQLPVADVGFAVRHNQQAMNFQWYGES